MSNRGHAIATAFGLRMPRRFLRGSGAGLALTVGAIACGVALVCAFDVASRGAVHAFEEVVETMAGRAALQVTAGDGGLFPEEVAARVAEVPGVETALPVLQATAAVGDGAERDTLVVHATDLTSDAAQKVYGMQTVVLEDALVLLAHDDSIVLTNPFAARHRLALGDRVELVVPGGRRAFTVRGLLEPAGLVQAFGGNVAVMDLYSAQPIFARQGLVTGVDVVVEPGADLASVTDAIAGVLPPGLSVVTPAQRRTDLHRVMRSLPVALDATGLFCLLAAFLIAFNRLSTVFEARTWQLGVMRALGIRRYVAWRELLKESLMIGAAGVVLGIPFGLGLGRLLLPVIATTAGLQHNLLVPEAALVVDATSIARAGLLGLVAAVLAAALPAWRASRVAPAATLRCQGTEQPGPAARASQIALGATVVALGAACATQTVDASAGPAIVATGLIAVATALAARPALGALGGLVRLPGVRRAVGPAAWFSVRNLLSAPRRTALALATVGVGLGAVVSSWTISASFQQSLVATLSETIRPDLIVTSAHVTAGYLEAPLDPQVIRELARVPGVIAIGGSRTIDWPFEGERIAINATDPRYFTHRRGGRWPLLGARLANVWRHVASGDAVVVSSNFLMRFGTKVGDRIVLDTPRGPLAVRIGGVTAAFQSPAGTIEMSRALYRRYWRDHRVNRIGIYVDSAVGVARVREGIAAGPAPVYELRVLSPGELIGHYASEVRRGFAPLFVLATMVLAVALLGVADTLAAGVLERRRQLGAMRALGVRRRSVTRMLLLEAAMLGSIGFVLATVSGLAMGMLWVKRTLPQLLGFCCELYFPTREVPVFGVITVAVCVAAALLPVRWAARLRPQEALRYE
jgi:putative ABC transport system permease protein